MILKTKYFSKWARKSGLNDALLKNAVLEIKSGLLDANLGSGIVKKRIALPGRGKRGSTRILLATNLRNRWFFIFGFEKNEAENVSEKELLALKMLADDLLGLSATQIQVAICNGSLVEVDDEK
jgi:hypothetical protein